ncbi:hypothetical protein BT93_L0166 [Corymbia citriodora subsp. variegata]|uniref:Uncharacterized protein n=1 Tax=Corymbia citriodora subsp. variegata TaxID=360336 RepID=A0A8T0CQK7_CORYI|nr:hypothetical protein BT93_L0166 [Corymbia citriodora subsp. variegata]
MSGTRTEHTHGTVTEIFSFECGRLIVMMIGHGVEQLPVWRVGGFVVNLYVQAITHIMMTTCCVGDIQWPMSRDSLVIRTGERSFAFVMQGLMYGFQLPSGCDEDTVDTLERVFIKFSDYTSLLDHGAKGYPFPEYQPNFWETARPVVEGMARKLGKNWQLMEGNTATSLSKVMRTSATVKTMSNAMVAGFLKPMHVDNYVAKVADRHKRYTSSEEAFSSISAITDVVNSLEMAWKIIAGDQQALEDADREDGSVKISRIKLWKLNQLGLAFFLRQKSNLLC